MQADPALRYSHMRYDHVSGDNAYFFQYEKHMLKLAGLLTGNGIYTIQKSEKESGESWHTYTKTI